MALQHLRSSTADKRPTPGAMSDGQLAMNTNLASPGLFFKDSNGDLVKTGPVHVGATAPNATPASGGQAGNSKGELWLDTSGTDYTLKTWDGSAWREIVVTSAMIKDGTIVNADVNASAAIAGTKISPNFGSQNVVTTGTSTAASLIPTGSSVPTNGVYLPAANSVAISTNGTGRLFVASDGKVGVGDVPGHQFHVIGGSISTDQVDGRIIGFAISDTFAASTTTAVYGITRGAAGANTVGLSGFAGLGFYTNNLERARIDSSGRLLVGTSTGQGNSLLQVKGESGSSTGVGSIFLQRGLSIATIGSSGQVDLAKIQFGNQDGAIGAVIQANADATWGTNDYPGRLTFSTTADGASSPTERMRITNNGSLLFNHTDNANLPGNGNTNTGATFEFTAGGPTLFISRDGLSLYTNRNSDGGLFSIRRSGAQVGSIAVTTAATSYNTSSDYRLKENVVLLTGAIDRLQQIPVYRFNFTADPDKTVDGFLAHEAQAIVPECVTGTKDEVDEDGNPVYQGIDQSKLVPLLTAALQEALQKIKDLEGRLDAAGI
jgi:hypothetical protein